MPGTWEPGGFPPQITLAAKIVLFADMSVRGVDYWVGDAPSTARRLSTVESAAPLWVWGALLLIGAAIGFASIVTRIGQGVLAAHLIGWLAHTLLSIGIISDVVQRTDAGWEALVWPGVVLAIGVVLTVLSFVRSSWQHAEITTMGVTVAATFAVAAIQFDGLRNATILLAVGVIHGLLAVGTASRLRQEKILREGAIV